MGQFNRALSPERFKKNNLKIGPVLRRLGIKQQNRLMVNYSEQLMVVCVYFVLLITCFLRLNKKVFRQQVRLALFTGNKKKKTSKKRVTASFWEEPSKAKT